MILRLCFRIGNAGKLVEKMLARIDVNHLGAEVRGQGLHHLLAFVEPQQTVVDEHASELLADRAVYQRCRHRGVDAARQPEQHLFRADLGAYAPDRLLDIAGHAPVAVEIADIEHEALDDCLALQRVGDFGMKLQRIEFARLIGHRGDRRCGIARDHLEAGRQSGHLVAMAHPYVEQSVAFGAHAVLDVPEQRRMASRTHFGIAEFAHFTAFDLAAELLGHGLHAVADAKHRHSELEYGRGRARRATLPHGCRSAGQDHTLRRELANEIVGNIVRLQLAIDVAFAHPARDQLRVLRAEIEDEDFLVKHGNSLG